MTKSSSLESSLPFAYTPNQTRVCVVGLGYIGLGQTLPSGFQWLEPAAMRHLGCLLLARVDGKSPAEYIRNEERKSAVRQAAVGLIRNPAKTATHCFDRLFS